MQSRAQNNERVRYLLLAIPSVYGGYNGVHHKLLDPHGIGPKVSIWKHRQRNDDGWINIVATMP